MITSTLLTLAAIPSMYLMWRRWQLRSHGEPRAYGSPASDAASSASGSHNASPGGASA
jgi:hypothetical protein